MEKVELANNQIDFNNLQDELKLILDNLLSYSDLKYKQKFLVLNKIFLDSLKGNKNIKEIENFIQTSIENLIKFNDSLEKDKSLTNNSLLIHKISAVIDENKGNFRKINKSSKETDIRNNSVKLIEEFIQIRHEVKTRMEQEKINKTVFSDIKELLSKINQKERSSMNLESIINELYLKLNNILNADVKGIKNLSANLISNLNKKKEKLFFEIKEIFTQKFRKDIFEINEKNVKLNMNKIDSKNNFEFLSITCKHFPEFLIEILQSLYDNFISYFPNQNYYFTKTEENEYTLELTDRTMRSSTNVIDDYVNNFELFFEILFKLIEIFKNIKDYLPSDFQTENLITCDILYGGTYKKSKNSFPFTLSYKIQQFYKIFKENVLDKIKDKNLNSEKETLRRISKLVKNYRQISYDLANNFESVKNFKFYDNSDFKLIVHEDLIKDNPKENEERDSLLNQKFKNEFFECREIIKNSYYEGKDLKLKQSSVIDLLNEVFELQITPEEIESIKIYDSAYKILNLDSGVIISQSFPQFIIKILKLNSSQNIMKILNLLHTFYTGYSKQKENSVCELLILHNNIESLILCLQFKFMMKINNDLIEEDVFKKIVIFFKNFSSSLINQIISDFIRELISELSMIETLEDIRFDRNYKNVEKQLKNSLDLIAKFFDLFKNFANEKDFLFYLNYVLSLYFDILNRKVLHVKDFNLEDMKVLIKISKYVSSELKTSFDKILKGSKSMNLETFANLLENNIKYKKFEEILFVLNANLKEIRNFIIQSSYHIHIDPFELIDLIKSTFEDNPNRNSLIDFINETCLGGENTPAK